MEGGGKIETEMERMSLCCICRYDGSTGEVSNLVARHRQDKVESIKVHILCPVDLLCKTKHSTRACSLRWKTIKVTEKKRQGIEH
jgi:hypothetical protein